MNVGINIHPTSRKLRVRRGGSYNRCPRYSGITDVAQRRMPEYRGKFNGFRVVVVKRRKR